MALFSRSFILLWQGQLVSQLGNQAFLIATTYYTLEGTGSATLVGVVMMASTVPIVLLGPIGGTLADRHSRRAILTPRVRRLWRRNGDPDRRRFADAWIRRRARRQSDVSEQPDGLTRHVARRTSTRGLAGSARGYLARSNRSSQTVNFPQPYPDEVPTRERLAQQHSLSRCQQLAAIKGTTPNLISNRPAASQVTRRSARSKTSISLHVRRGRETQRQHD